MAARNTRPKDTNQQLFTRREAAKRHGFTYQAIKEWDDKGWLTRAAERPFRYTAAALDAAKAKANEARREGHLHAARTLRAKADKHNRPGRILMREAKERLKVSDDTMRSWRNSCPYLPGNRGIQQWPKDTPKGTNVPIYVATADIGTIESKINGNARVAAVERLRPVRQKHVETLRKKGVARRYPKPAEGLGTAAEAAAWAGVSYVTIRILCNNGELTAASKEPLGFDRDVVKAWAASQIKGQDDMAIIDIPARLPGPPGKIDKAGRSQKLNRVRSIISRLGIYHYCRRDPTKKRQTDKRPKRRIACIHKDRFAEVEAEYLAITTDTKDEVRPDEIKIEDAPAEYKRGRKTIITLLAQHAPDCVRTVTLKRQNGARHPVAVAPRAAIEAALRGETWTPSAETFDSANQAGDNALKGEWFQATATRDDKAPAANGKTLPTDPPKKSKKARPGRPSKWANLLKVYDRLREKNSETEERNLRREAVTKYNRQYAGRGTNPRAIVENLSGALKSRRAAREKSG